MFIRNTWYVAAEPQEVRSGQLLARTLLNEKIVMFRGTRGQVLAFKDACPHRYAPLSRGWLEGSCLRCPYHGALYDEAGRCVEVPGQKGEHGMEVALTSYPVIERHNYIWIWMGDPALASDETSIPDWFAPADPDSPVWHGRHDRFLSMPVYYELINDNLHDVTHTQFVHPETLGAELMGYLFRMAKGEQSDAAYMKQHVEDRYLQLDFHIEDVQGGPMFHSMLAYQRECTAWPENIDWDLTVRYGTPAAFSFNPRTKAPGDAPERAIEFASLNAITPETDKSSHYFFYTANNLDSTPERVADFTLFCADGIRSAFTQDKHLLAEQMQRVPDAGINVDSLTRVSFMGDMVPVIGRRMIRRQLEEEAAADQPLAAVGP